MTSRRALSTLFALLLTTAALALGIAAPASAHAALTSSSPADGAELEEAPAEIVLEFNEDIQDIGNEIVVLDSEGTPVADGDPVVDGPTVTQAVTGGAAGTFTVTWRVVSADGHPISGDLSYEVAPTDPTTASPEATTEASTATTTEAATTEASAAPSSDTAAQEDGGGDSAIVWIVIGAVVAAAVAIVLIMRRNRAV